MSPNDNSYSLLFQSFKPVGKNQYAHTNFCGLFFLSSPFRSKVKFLNSFKKPYSISMMPGQYGSGMSMLSDQEESIPSADEFTDPALAQELLPERLLAQLQLEKIESRR